MMMLILKIMMMVIVIMMMVAIMMMIIVIMMVVIMMIVKIRDSDQIKKGEMHWNVRNTLEKVRNPLKYLENLLRKR